MRIPAGKQRDVYGFLLSFETTPFRRQHPTNVSTTYSRSFASEIRYFFLPYTKYASEKLPFSSAKSLAECSPPIYVVLPETKKDPCIQSINDGRRGLGDNLYDQRNAVIFSENAKNPAWIFIQTGLWNVILAGEWFGSKSIAKLRDDIYFVVKVWKSITTSEYLIFRGEKGWYLRRNTTKAPISRCFCSWHLFCPV